VRARLYLAALYIEDFKSWLRDRGYKTTTIEELVRVLACWTDWAHAAGFTLDTIVAGHEASMAVFKGSRTATAGALFIRYLQDHSLVPQSLTSVPSTELWPILGAFHGWMRAHRGIAESSLDTYRTILVDFLQALGGDAQAYTHIAVGLLQGKAHRFVAVGEHTARQTMDLGGDPAPIRIMENSELTEHALVRRQIEIRHVWLLWFRLRSKSISTETDA
jgi:hypothetical protein